MFSARHCRDQAAECVRLMNSAPTRDHARLLENISVSLTRLAGQIDRYNDLMRKQGVQREEKAVQQEHRAADRSGLARLTSATVAASGVRSGELKWTCASWRQKVRLANGHIARRTDQG
jgi:hypothetical protein